MNDVKSAVRSKSIWGGLIAGLAIIAGFFGIDLTAADQAELGGLVEEAFAAWDRIVALAGVALAIYGRVVAKSKIV
ncbi:hypothetical protein J0X15_12390 [Roseibium sp. CAU 1637]|uniref:Uncharacterized protein n=1 Tax=Roseibium limicola TaxID=2816037 RepID=A0A939ERZ0_9HYPH|nr:hypothetical protein [Roseibium limicola]MBO0346024.1 hypothetical protein [Roseibium limicola]